MEEKKRKETPRKSERIGHKTELRKVYNNENDNDNKGTNKQHNTQSSPLSTPAAIIIRGNENGVRGCRWLWKKDTVFWRFVLCRVHAGQGGGHPPEQLLNVVARLRTRLDEHHVQLLGLALALLRRHLPLVRQVRLVAHQHDDHVAAPFRAHVIDPLGRLVERVCI